MKIQITTISNPTTSQTLNDSHHKNGIVDIEKNQSLVHGLNNALSSSVTWVVELFGSCHFRVSFGPDSDDLLYY